MKLHKILSLIALPFLISCTSAQINDYQDEKPILSLEEYFSGTIDAYGVFQNRSGKVVKRFHCLIVAKWNGNTGVLDESFTYSDGTTSKRIWRLTSQGDGKFVGIADDVIGEAQGQVRGNAFHWKYVLDLPVDGKNYQVSFDDWMYLMNDKVMLNRSAMSKFGIHLGEVTLTFVKR